MELSSSPVTAPAYISKIAYWGLTDQLLLVLYPKKSCMCTSLGHAGDLTK